MLKFKKKNVKWIIAHSLTEHYIVQNGFASFYWHDKLFIIIFNKNTQLYFLLNVHIKCIDH